MHHFMLFSRSVPHATLEDIFVLSVVMTWMVTFKFSEYGVTFLRTKVTIIPLSALFCFKYYIPLMFVCLLSDSLM